MAGARAFEGVNVLDMGWIGVGPITAKHFADHGATVIRIESMQRPDALRMAGPFIDATPGINRSQFWANFNSGKLGMGLNLATESGRTLAYRLAVEWAHVVIEGHVPGNMQAWGLSYQELSRVRPDLIMLSTCQVGQTGPYHLYKGYGSQAAAMAGYYQVTGWPDRPPVMVYGAYTDFLAPHFCVTLVASALVRRRQTGRGVSIDSSQLESGIWMQHAAVLDYAANGRVAERMGNRDERAVPHGVFPCRGDDRWVAIAVFSDEQWAALCRAMGREDLAADPDYATAAKRREREDAVEELLAGWTQGFTPGEVMTRLQAAGVPAGGVWRTSDLHEDPQLQHWGFFQWREHPSVGAMPYDGLMSRLSRTPGAIARAPKMAEHTEYVLREVLSLSDDDIAELLAEGAVEFPPE